MAMSAPPPPAPCMICAAAAACHPGEVVPEGGERDELRQRGEEVGTWPVRHGVESHLYETLLEVRVLVVRPFRKVLEEMHPYLLDPGLQTIRLEQHSKQSNT
ncbi:Os04g0269900 [Oryza sativa Japonica Group]|uniref:Os04g0269900 protein n=1 Tax=Oryza sativa subsp. japonica TaxID=39947 RepID=Q0JEI3_ORYSJ|nr:Os04g0269900 [Oryza sativa Japonica Group]|eukprot:NP_001052340.1 Os04g0269900 [Oryza sativa Japonica Group]